MKKPLAPEASNQADRPPLSFGTIEALVHQGKNVVSLEDSAVVEWAMKAIAEGITATLYCKPSVFEAIRRRYWTPERAKIVGFRPISAEVSARVKRDFNIEVDGYANSLDCPRCEHVYSTYEFIHQGIEEHGIEHVRAAFSLKRAAIIQINPVQDLVCRNCRLHILVGGGGNFPYGDYDYEYRCVENNAYACCRAADIRTA
ncbi:hypothetical protein ACFOYU_17165 [Microvirga sp. GCM10011540]|uniref:hypothetical protein n=1 Tax=Microvirga sp. GCM10011540 TaxID=3317338 RepID=UPI00361DEA00